MSSRTGKTMSHDISHLLSRLINGPIPLRQINFADAGTPAPAQATQVDFPRLEIVLEGMLLDSCIVGNAALMAQHDMLYVPAGGWTMPQWQTPVTTLSVLFGKQQLVFSVTHWDGVTLQNTARQHVTRRGPRIGSFLLQALHEMQMQPQQQQTARMVATALLSYCADLLGSQIQIASRSQALFAAIRSYIDENYVLPLSRESVAQVFIISPTYLSHLFQKTGTVGFTEYLNHTRLEHAKYLLKSNDLKVKEIAHACGFVDSNYFCRLFRKTTGLSPSEYRQRYHSELIGK